MRNICIGQETGTLTWQTPTTCENNGGGYPDKYQGMNGYSYSYTALDGNHPVSQILCGPFTVHESANVVTTVTPSAGPGAGVAHQVSQGTEADGDGSIMNGELVGKASNGTFTDFIGIKNPDGICTAWEKAINVNLPDKTTMIIIIEFSNHNYILHKTDANGKEVGKPFPLAPLSGTPFTQEVGYGYVKSNGKWILDPTYATNPVLLK